MVHYRSFLHVRASALAGSLLGLAFVLLALVGCGGSAQQSAQLSTRQVTTMATRSAGTPLKKPGTMNNDIAVNIVQLLVGQGHEVAFVPSSIVVLPGTTVIWNNTTGEDQTLVSPTNGVFSPTSKVLKNGSLKMTFTTAEAVAYGSKEHPEAKATLLVQPATAAVAVRLMEQTGPQGTGYVLSPAGIVIKVGTAVTWNNETNQSQVLAGDKTNVFSAASMIAQKSSYRMVFSVPGTYSYYSKMFPTTRGVVVVVP